MKTEKVGWWVALYISILNYCSPLIMQSYAKCIVNSHHIYIPYLDYNIHIVIFFKHNNQSIINTLNMHLSNLFNIHTYTQHVT